MRTFNFLSFKRSAITQRERETTFFFSLTEGSSLRTVIESLSIDHVSVPCSKESQKNPFLRDLGFFLKGIFFVSEPYVTAHDSRKMAFDELQASFAVLQIPIQVIPDIYFEGGNIVVDEERKCIFHGITCGGYYSLAKAELSTHSLAKHFESEGYTVLALEFGYDLSNEAKIQDFFHLDTVMHLLPTGELLCLCPEVFTNESQSLLQEKYQQDLHYLVPKMYSAGYGRQGMSPAFKKKGNIPLNIVILPFERMVIGCDKFPFQTELETFFRARGFSHFVQEPLYLFGGPHCRTLEVPHRFEKRTQDLSDLEFDFESPLHLRR